MRLKIYNQAGELKLTASTSSSSTWNMELMVENAVSVSFTHPSYVTLDVNDYVMLAGVKFSINKEYKPKQKSTLEYNYNVKFYGPEHDGERVMYLNLTDGQYDVQFSLDGSPREHLKKWVDNMNRIYGREVWSMGDVVIAPNQTIEYNNLNCWDALASIAEAFETEWWADGFTMNLSRCERGERVELGYLQGLTSLTQAENSDDVKFFTRLIPLGSTKNIDRSRYGYTRLQLPDKSTYVDRNTQYGLYEYVEEAAFAEIFPHYTGTVSSVRTEEKTEEDGKKFTVYYFKDNGMTFDPCENEIGGLVKQLSFQTGDLAGRDFEANYNSQTKEWEIINIYPDEEMQIPGGNLIPRMGDKYIPWNFRMPTEYETQAELDYKAAVDDYLKKFSEDISKYGGDTDYIYIDKNKVPLMLGQNVRLMSDEYFGAVGYRDSRMTKVVRKLDNLSIATIECTNLVGKGWKTQVDSSISQLKYVVGKKEETTLDVMKSWDGREINDYRVLSGLRTLKEIKQRALSRLERDEAAGHIEFKKGTTVENGLIIRSLLTARELRSKFSEELLEEGAADAMSVALLEEGGGAALSVALLEEPAAGDGGGATTVGELDNADESWDTVPDGIYSWQKKGNVYYPVKGSGGSSSKMSLSFVSSATPVVAYGRDFTIYYTFTSVMDGEATGPGTVTYTLNNKIVASANIEQGNNSFSVGRYLSLGDNTLVVQVTDNYGNTRKLTYAINAISISVSSTFDDTKAYKGAITFPYTPIGAITKTVHFKVDGTEIGTVETTISNRQQTYAISGKSHGVHSLEVYITATVDGTAIESEHLYYDIICLTDGNNTPIIASAFKATEVQQFDTVSVPFIVYSPNASTSSITLKANNTVVATQTVDRKRQVWSYRANEEGKLTLSIACGSVSKTFSLTVNKSSINVTAETQDLELHLTSQNRNNSDVNREEWKYGDISAVLTGFNWKTNGWVKDDSGYSCLRVTPGARVDIPLKLFGADFRSDGKTIEFEFVVRDVYNYDTPVISCWTGNRGVQITSQSAILKSEQSSIDTKFRDEERVRLAFVVEKRSENRLLSIYVNGIKSGTYQYPDADNFMQAGAVGISIGCDDSTVDIYNIRVYSNNLNRYQLLDNYIADMDDITQKIALYIRNQIYDDYGNVSFRKVNSMIDCLVFEGDLPQYKGDKKTNKIYHYSSTNPQLNWVAKVKNDVQGTSSQYYPRKNYKFEFLDGITYLESGQKAEMYQVTDEVLPAKVFCIKTDFAESSGTHNTGVANMIDWELKELGFLTEPQKTNGKIRTTVAGRPFVLFHKATADSEPEFIGKVNLNTDKAAENTFGFKAGDESVEFLNNTSDIALFKTADLTNWTDTLEFRYPDGGSDITNTQKVFEWIVSCKGNPTKFKTEVSQYFDKNQLLFYALMTLCLGMVDQRAKNMFLSHVGSKLWLFLFYDNDTILPINNEALIAFLYNVEIQDTIGNQNVWNGADSELWKLVDEVFADEIRQLYYDMRQKNILSYDRLMEFLYKRQAEMWSEAIYNEDGFYKYEQPLTEGYLDYSQSHERPEVVKTSAYLYALQGSREMYGKWIWKNRFLYLDSKFLAGSILSDTAVFRTYTPAVWTGVEPCADITLTSFNAMYFNIKWGSVTKSQRVGFNETVKMIAPTGMQFNDTETIVYGASLIASLGDLSPLYVGSVDVSKMTRLKELIIGSTVEGYRNTNFTVLSVGTNNLLTLLNIANCPNFTAPIDLSGCSNIREIYAQGTSATAVMLPEAGIVEKLHLPGSITSLTIMNQINLTAAGLVLEGVQNLSTIRWENTNSINPLSIVERCFALDTVKLDRVRLVGVDWYISTLDMVVKLTKLKGLDEHGNNTDTAVVTGKCYVTVAMESQLNKIKAAFPELVITYGQLKPTPVTTFTFSSSAYKSITNAVFTCNVEYDKVNEYTYKVAVEDGTTVNLTFKCDNHVEISKSYLTASTRTQSYSVTYIPLRTIRVKVYNQSVYVPGATVTANGKSYIADTNGSITIRGGEAVSGEVSAYGYAGNTFSFGAITNDTTNTVEVYAAVDVKFVVKFSSTLIVGAKVKSGAQEGVTNQYGECILSLGKGSHEYAVTHPEYLTKTGSVSVGTSAMTVNVSVEPAKVDLKFVVKDKGSAVLDGAKIAVNGLVGTTDANGECTLRVDSKQKHTYTVSKYGFFDYAGEVTVSVSDATVNVAMLFNTELFKPEENDNIQMLLKGTEAALNITSPTADYVIDWGDGTTDNASGTGAITYNHTYETTGNYQVEVRSCENVTACNGTKTCVVAYWGIGKSKVVNLSFNSFGSLSYVGLVFKNDNGRTNFDSCLGGCSSLSSIPTGLFDNCPAVTDFYYCFGNCSSLTSIPTGLFDNCPVVTRFDYCFRDCSSLTSIPTGLFDNCPAVTIFKYCFSNCSSLTSIPTGLFDNCPAVTSFDCCFYNCPSLSSIPTGLFDNCPAVTDFSSCFCYCSSLSSIPAGLFDNCPAVTYFNYCFRGCSSLSSIPAGLFDNCPAVTSFYSCFDYCISLSSIPAGLFDNCPAVTSFGSCFSDCSSLSSIPAGLFDNCPAVTSFSYFFYRCRSLTSIPTGLFDNCLAVTDFSYCFGSCSKLQSFTSKLTKVDNFMFYYCPVLTLLQISNATVVPMTNTDVFIGSNSALQIKVPAHLVDSYKVATNWVTYADKISAI